jgi:hypothetical protein
MQIKTFINWRLFALLLTWSILSVVAVFPYALSLQAGVLETVPLPLSTILILSIVQSLILYSIVICIGLRLSKTVGLHIPILEAYIAKQKIPSTITSYIVPSLALGVIVGIVIILLDSVFIRLGVDIAEQISVPIRQGFLASFYGAIGEEIMMRLFFMSLIVWICSKLFASKKTITRINITMWWAIILAALLFGIGHLPATAIITALTPLVIFRALLLNGIWGIVFGRLYWKRGLEFSMIAHFWADIVLHVIPPLLIQ